MRFLGFWLTNYTRLMVDFFDRAGRLRLDFQELADSIVELSKRRLLPVEVIDKTPDGCENCYCGIAIG